MNERKYSFSDFLSIILQWKKFLFILFTTVIVISDANYKIEPGDFIYAKKERPKNFGFFSEEHRQLVGIIGGWRCHNNTTVTAAEVVVTTLYLIIIA